MIEAATRRKPEFATGAPVSSLTPRDVARALGGEAHGRHVLCPGPGHSRTDRSLSVTLEDGAPEGFIVYSFTGDDPLVCRDYVRERLNLPARDRRMRPDLPKRSPPIVVPDADRTRREERALSIWRGARDVRDTPAETYLRSRGLDVAEDLRHVLRFSGSLRLDGKPVCGVVALMCDAISDVRCGLHRTFLHPDGRPILNRIPDCPKCTPAACRGHKVRKMLGRAKGAAIKLDAHEDIVSGLHIGEGVETCLAARQLSYRPVWALGSAGAIAMFPVLPGIEAITVFAENDDASNRAAEACCARYEDTGLEAWICQPPSGDMNDVIKRAP